MRVQKNKIIYLDNAAGTPIDDRVLKSMALYDKENFANPGAIHSLGVKAKSAINASRSKIASLLNAHSDEIIFTGSATESDALAVLGLVNHWRILHKKNKQKNNKSNNKGKGQHILPHIITTSIEHSAVLENCKFLEREGLAEVTYIRTDEFGVVNSKDIKNALKENTILVSVIYANNEIGTIQPIQEIAKVIRNFQTESGVKARFHIDATQAMNYLFTENVDKLGIDLMSFNGSKIYGPKGVGVLYKKRGVEISPIYFGGGQESGFRSGTENVAGILGIATALEIACKMKKKESARLTLIRDYGIRKLLELVERSSYKIILNGSSEVRLPNNINISISGISSELLVIELSARGIIVSSKSACKSEDEEESHVISALHQAENIKPDTTLGSLRISLGRGTKKQDMDQLVFALENILNKYKSWK